MATADESSISSDFYDWAGLDHITSPLLVRENKLIQSVNFTSSGIVGGKVTRPPYGLFLNNPDGKRVRNLFSWQKQNNDGTTTSYLIRISGTSFYYYIIGSVATTWTPASGFTCTDQNQPFAWTVLANKLHLSNGTDNYQTWDGTTFAADTSAPKFRTMTTFQRRIFGSNIPGASSRVIFSSVDYIGAPGENAPLTNSYGPGATNIQINDSPSGINPFATSNSLGAVYYPAILGSGTANQENIIVIGITGTVAPYTLTLAGPTVNAHNAGDIVVNNAAWFSDNNNASTANYFDVDPERNGAVIYLDTVNANLTMHKASGALYLYSGQSISNPLQSANPFYASPGSSTVSPFAPDQISGIEIYPTRDGVYAYSGGYPTIISNEIYDFIQNMDSTNVGLAPGIAFKQKWYYAIGTVTDAFGYTVTNCILVYDYILNIWDTYSFTDMPTAFGSYVDATGSSQMVFGTSDGKTFLFNSGTGDNGKPINCVLQTHYLTWGAPEKTKDVESYMTSTNPGANFQLMASLDWHSNQWITFANSSGLGQSDRAPDSLKNWKSLALRLISNTVYPMTFYGLTFKVALGSKRFSGRRI